MTAPLEHSLSPQDVGTILGVTAALVREEIHRGNLRAERVGNRLRVPVGALAEYREARRVEPSSGEVVEFRRRRGRVSALRALEEEAR